MRAVLKDEERRLMPCTSYPFFRSDSARYEPSWPVIPVINAIFFIRFRLRTLRTREHYALKNVVRRRSLSRCSGSDFVLSINSSRKAQMDENNSATSNEIPMIKARFGLDFLS